MARGKAAEQAEIPAGAVPVVAPAGVTAVSGGVCVDGRWYVTAEIAETLVRMHGFLRG